MKPKFYKKETKPENKQHDRRWSGELGSTMARVPRAVMPLSDERPDPVVVPPGLSPEEYRLWKLAESKLERERLNRLLKENSERVHQERKASVN